MVKYTDQVSLEVHLYKYDALGRRIGKVVDSTGLTGGPTETRYYYGGKGYQQVIEEQDELGNTQATYVYGMYIDDTVQMRRGGQDYYYHCDDLYNTMAITDSAGVVVERYEYGDYGQVEFRDASGSALATQASAIRNPYTFTGRRFDEETGLYWYRTRYYDSAAGRFASRDSIGIWGDPIALGNGLAYVGNNPWTNTDPHGKFFGAVFLGISAVIAIYTTIRFLQSMQNASLHVISAEGKEAEQYLSEQQLAEQIHANLDNFKNEARKSLEKIARDTPGTTIGPGVKPALTWAQWVRKAGLSCLSWLNRPGGGGGGGGGGGYGPSTVNVYKMN